jgi:hypothetical protein
MANRFDKLGYGLTGIRKIFCYQLSVKLHSGGAFASASPISVFGGFPKAERCVEGEQRHSRYY